MSIHYGHDIYYEKHSTSDQKLYKTVFDVNMLKAVKSGQADKGVRVGRVQDSEYSLFQSEYRRGPIPGLDFIQNTRKCFMIFKCPEMVNINVSVFVVLRVIGDTNNSGKWAYIIGNDNGGYDKFIGYKTGTTNQLSYGGGFPTKEYNCTIQSDVSIFEKHIISCHWLLSGSFLYINGKKSVDSDFFANPKTIGETCSTIFVNDRFIGTTGPLSKPFKGEIYDIKVISGFLEPDDINDINRKIMNDHGILQAGDVLA